MSEGFESLYGREKKVKSGKSSPERRKVSVKRYQTYNFLSGEEEVVDLFKVDEEGGCCPHIIDVPGAYVIKGCKLQPTIRQGVKGVERHNVICSPLCYINHWKDCPLRKGREGETD